MFTGIVTDIGEVIGLDEESAALRKARIAASWPANHYRRGASIACSGICLTVIDWGAAHEGSWFEVQIAAETLSRTLAGTWQKGTRLNLEPALSLGQSLDGHLVTGHVDALAEILSREDLGEASGPSQARFMLHAPAPFHRFIAEKGSVALDGTSLTVNWVSGGRFSVLLIPESLAVTTWGMRRAGDRVHLEVDLLARYAARLAETAGKP